MCTGTQTFAKIEDLVYSVFKVHKQETHFVCLAYTNIIAHTFCMSMICLLFLICSHLGEFFYGYPRQTNKKLRMENGFSQKKLADMVGIVTTHLQAYEYGTRHPKEEILDRLALALDVVPSMLQPLDVDTVEGLLGIIYEMHTSYHGLEIVEDEDGRVSIRLPDTLQAMPAKKSLLRIKRILDQSTRNLPEPEYQSEEQLAEGAEILPDTSVSVGQERRWQKEHRGLLMHATDLYKPEINYIQLFADKEAIQNSEDDTDSEDIPL